MTKEKRFILTIFILLIILFVFKVLLHGENSIIIKLKQNSFVSDNYIYLKDISLIVGDKKLENIKIAKSPEAAQSVYINKGYIYNIVQSKVKDKKIQIIGPENIKITRRYFIFNEKIIKNLCINFLKQHSNQIFGSNRWRILQIICPDQIILPYKNVDVQIKYDDSQKTNRLPLQITFYKKNSYQILKKVNITIFFEIFKKVVVARQNISIRKIITPTMIMTKEVPIKNFYSNYITSIKNVVGKITTRFIRQGQVITLDMVKTPPLVKRGQLVKVIATDGKGILITTIGKALENGFLNNYIRVMNITSGKVFLAKVNGLNQVIVRF